MDFKPLNTVLVSPALQSLLHPRTHRQWKIALRAVKLLYLQRHYKECIARAAEILENAKQPIDNVYHFFLKFYTAISYDELGRLAHPYSVNKIPFLERALENFVGCLSVLPEVDSVSGVPEALARVHEKQSITLSNEDSSAVSESADRLLLDKYDEKKQGHLNLSAVGHLPVCSKSSSQLPRVPSASGEAEETPLTIDGLLAYLEEFSLSVHERAQGKLEHSANPPTGLLSSRTVVSRYESSVFSAPEKREDFTPLSTQDFPSDPNFETLTSPKRTGGIIDSLHRLLDNSIRCVMEDDPFVDHDEDHTTTKPSLISSLKNDLYPAPLNIRKVSAPAALDMASDSCYIERPLLKTRNFSAPSANSDLAGPTDKLASAPLTVKEASALPAGLNEAAPEDPSNPSPVKPRKPVTRRREIHNKGLIPLKLVEKVKEEREAAEAAGTTVPKSDPDPAKRNKFTLPLALAVNGERIPWAVNRESVSVPRSSSPLGFQRISKSPTVFKGNQLIPLRLPEEIKRKGSQESSTRDPETGTRYRPPRLPLKINPHVRGTSPKRGPEDYQMPREGPYRYMPAGEGAKSSSKSNLGSSEAESQKSDTNASVTPSSASRVVRYSRYVETLRTQVTSSIASVKAMMGDTKGLQNTRKVSQATRAASASFADLSISKDDSKQEDSAEKEQEHGEGLPGTFETKEQRIARLRADGFKSVGIRSSNSQFKGVDYYREYCNEVLEELYHEE